MGIERQTLKFNWKKQCKNGQDTSGGKDGRSAGRPYSYGSLLTETAQDLFAANNSGVNPWSRRTPRAAEQLNPCATTTEPVLQSLGATATEPTCPRARALCIPEHKFPPACFMNVSLGTSNTKVGLLTHFVDWVCLISICAHLLLLTHNR